MEREALSDLVVLSKKEAQPKGYSVIEQTADGKPVNLGESKLWGAKRFLGYTKQQPSPREGHAVVTDMKLLAWSETAPHDYFNIATTADDSKEVFPGANKSLFVQFKKISEAPQAITDLVILSSANKAKVPSGYRRLPDINGFSICFKIGPFKGACTQPPPAAPVKTTVSQPTGSAPPAVTQPPPTQMVQPPPPPSQQEGLMRQSSIAGHGPAVKAFDGISVKLAETYDMAGMMAKFDLVQRVNLLSIDDIQQKYSHNFSFEEEVTGAA